MLVATAALFLVGGTTPPLAEDEVAALVGLDRSISGVSDPARAMRRFDDAVIAPMLPAGGLVARTDFLSHLAAEDGPGSRMFLEPVRAGVSADRTHGFTLGHLSVLHRNGSMRRMKYLAYWIKRPRGWRIVAFKRVARPAGPISVETLEPSAPARRTAGEEDAALALADAESLAAAERAFSAEAQRSGLGPTFARHGRSDAVNMGTGSDFTIGADRIGDEIGKSAAQNLNWGPDGVIVAPTGDLGLTWGRIRSNDPRHSKWSAPFFTIWSRAGRHLPWRYVAE